MHKSKLGAYVCAATLSMACLPLLACSTSAHVRAPAATPAPHMRAMASGSGFASKQSLVAHASESAAAKPRGGVELPCQLLVSEQGNAVVLDFHAEGAPVARVRAQVRELERYINTNRGRAEAVAAPDGHPEPTTFALRRILDAQPVASTEDLDDGARLTLMPADWSRREQLRARVLWHAGDLLPGLPLRGKVCPELPPQIEAANRATAE